MASKPSPTTGAQSTSSLAPFAFPREPSYMHKFVPSVFHQWATRRKQITRTKRYQIHRRSSKTCHHTANSDKETQYPTNNAASNATMHSVGILSSLGLHKPCSLRDTRLSHLFSSSSRKCKNQPLGALQ
jgi:hypothetical protein